MLCISVGYPCVSVCMYMCVVSCGIGKYKRTLLCMVSIIYRRPHNVHQGRKINILSSLTRNRTIRVVISTE